MGIDSDMHTAGIVLYRADEDRDSGLPVYSGGERDAGRPGTSLQGPLCNDVQTMGAAGRSERAVQASAYQDPVEVPIDRQIRCIGGTQADGDRLQGVDRITDSQNRALHRNPELVDQGQAGRDVGILVQLQRDYSLGGPVAHDSHHLRTPCYGGAAAEELGVQKVGACRIVS
ncbi:hypothetical protein DSECCO2_534300 [anaerobic digester metagenome]